MGSGLCGDRPNKLGDRWTARAKTAPAQLLDPEAAPSMGASGEGYNVAVPEEEVHSVIATGQTPQGALGKVVDVYGVELHGCTEAVN